MTELVVFTPAPHDPPVLQAVPEAIAQIAAFLPPEEVRLFVSNLALYVRGNELLAQCDPSTTLQAVLQSARLGLTLGTEAYLVPFKIKATDKRPEYVSASLIPGYKGMIALAQRLHGIQIIADVICVGDEYEEAFGLVTHHKHSLTPGVVIAAYAIARHPSWVQPVGVFLPRQAIEKRNKGGNFWGPYFARMARKTAVRDLWNSGYLPQNDVRLREVMDLQYPENAITPPPVRQIAAVTRLELTADTSPIETTATEEEVF